MAGYIFNLNKEDSLVSCVENGIYSTNLTAPKNNLWGRQHEGTFADYMSMKERDNVYFFIDRKIYGIGELKNINLDCKYQNYPNALLPSIKSFKEVKDSILFGNIDENINNRIVCLFKPSPNFFKNGIDMDDILSSKPRSFRMLRAFWKLSFVKIDDEENKALKDIILKRNEDFINNKNECYTFSEKKHEKIEKKLNENYILSSKDLLKSCFKNSSIRHEMAIECSIIDSISSQSKSIFGEWDYVSHQVIASPFKPIDYMDKMDIFGYRYIAGFDTISKYLLIEIKRDKATIESIDQIMKYVDWINQEYSFGDYSMIEAFLVAYDFPEYIIEYRNRTCMRNFTKGRRPTVSETWTNVKLVKYRYDSANGSLDFELV